MRKGVSREIISFVLILLIVTFFLALVIYFFREEIGVGVEKIREVFVKILSRD